MLRSSVSRVLLLQRLPASTAAVNPKTREIPYCGGLPILGTGLEIQKAGGNTKFHEYVDSRHKTLGPIFKENMGGFKGVFISDPNLMRQVFSVEGKHPEHFVPKGWALYNKIHGCKRGLFFMEGEEWYKHRKIMNKSFLSPDTIPDLKGVHESITAHFIQRWSQFDGKEVKDIDFEFYMHSISFVLGSLIGDVYSEKRDLYSPYVDEIARKSRQIFEISSKLEAIPSVRLVQLLNLSIWKQFETAVKTSLEASRRVVSMALSDLSPNGLLHKLLEENIPLDIIYAIVSDLLLAAGDTTSYTSQWISYFLGKHAEAQDAARKDPSLVRGIIRETLRLCPPAIFISRVIPEETTLGGYRLDKGELVLLSLYSCGRDNRVYPSADNFLPERWNKIPGTTKYKGVNETSGYLPFAMGVRSCVGVRLANAQLKLTVSELLKKYKLSTLEDVEIVLRLVPVPSKPLRIHIKSL